MAINRFYKRTPYEGELYSPPINVIAKGLEYAQETFDTNLDYLNKVKNNYIQSLPSDRARANELQNEYEKLTSDVISKHNGDLSQATRELRELQNRIAKDYGPGGEAGAIQERYKTYADWLTRQQERVKSGKVLADDLNYASQYFLAADKGAGHVDPVTGNYNRFYAEDLADYVDPDSIVRDVYKEFKPQTYESGHTEFKNGLQTNIKTKYTGIAPERLAPSFASALSNHPQLASYLAQKARLSGASIEDVQTYMNQYAQKRANDLGYMDRSETSESVRDPLYMENVRAAHAKDLADYKHKLKGKEVDALLRGNYSYEPVAGMVHAKPPDIDPNNWRNNGIEAATDRLGMARQRVGMDLANPDKVVINPPETRDLEQALKDENFTRSRNVDPSFAMVLLEDMKKDMGPAYNRYYGKSKTWTDNFEKDFWGRYTEQSKSMGAYQPTSVNIPITSVAGVLSNILPSVNSNTATVYKPGDNVTQTAEAAGIDMDKILDKNGKLNTNVVGAKYVFPDGRAFIEGGVLIDYKGNQFVVVDQSVQRQTINRELKAAYDPVFKQGRPVGGSLELNGIHVAPIVTYPSDRQGNYKREVRYITSVTDPKTKKLSIVPARIQEDPSNPASIRDINEFDIMDSRVRSIQSVLDFGASKSDLTPNQFYNLLNDDN